MRNPFSKLEGVVAVTQKIYEASAEALSTGFGSVSIVDNCVTGIRSHISAGFIYKVGGIGVAAPQYYPRSANISEYSNREWKAKLVPTFFLP